MQLVLLSLGSSIGDRKKNIDNALYLLELVGVKQQRQSSYYETEPVGGVANNKFLNTAFLAQTNFTPKELLFICKSIEFALGRRVAKTWADREIDIDILLYEDEIIETSFLKIPHPFFHNRRFALEPAVEIAPNMVHPKFKKKLEYLLQECQDKNEVKKLLNINTIK